jgi:hypothetical protein
LFFIKKYVAPSTKEKKISIAIAAKLKALTITLPSFLPPLQACGGRREKSQRIIQMSE